jgi:hypothetical protein
MAYLIFVPFAVWIFFDARKREEKSILWAIGTALLGIIVLPVWFAKRPLLAGEVREGGTAWNILKNFALFWTILMVVGAISTMVGVSQGVNAIQDDAELAGAAIGTALGLGLIGALWFFPMVGALVLGFFLKKSSVIERGPAIGHDSDLVVDSEATPVKT